jgi:SAM-dependent methyltransferase
MLAGDYIRRPSVSLPGLLAALGMTPSQTNMRYAVVSHYKEGIMINLLELVDALELTESVRSMATPLKLVALGKVAGMQPGNRVIDFGCGMGEALALWAQYFGIRGTGIDLSGREAALQRLSAQGLAGQVDIITANATSCQPSTSGIW